MSRQVHSLPVAPPQAQRASRRFRSIILVKKRLLPVIMEVLATSPALQTAVPQTTKPQPVGIPMTDFDATGGIDLKLLSDQVPAEKKRQRSWLAGYLSLETTSSRHLQS